MLNFGNKEFRNLEEQVRKNQTDINGLKSGVVIYKKVDYNDLASYCSDAYLGKYFVAEYLDQNHLFTITRSGAYDNLSVVDLGIWPAAGPQGATGLTGAKGEKGDSIIGPRGFKGDQGAPGRGVDSLSGIDTLSYEAEISQPDANGIVEVDTSADVDFGGEDPTVIDFKFKYKVPTDFYGKSTVDSKDAAVLAAAKSYTDAVEANITPHIGDNNNWYIGDYDTGVLAEGAIVESVVKTATVGLVDTYTMTFSNGDTATFTVTNGAEGGVGPQGVGIQSIVLTQTAGLVDTYTITYTNGNTSTFNVTNGQDGQDGQDGATGPQGPSGYGFYNYNGNITVYTDDVSLTDIDVPPLGPALQAGDMLIGYNGGVANIIAIEGSTVYVQYLMSLKGANGTNYGENYLINSDFAINQRGAASYSTQGKYSVDRWLMDSDSTLTPQTKGITLIGTCRQHIDGLIPNVWGKTLALSICTNLGTYSAHATLPASAPADGTTLITTAADANDVKAMLVYSSSHLSVVIGGSDAAAPIYWVKLEIGSTATAYHDPSPVTEMAKCRDFFQIFTTDDSYKEYAFGQFVTSTQAYVSLPCQPMRTTPTLIYYSMPSSFNVRWGTHLVDGSPVAYQATCSGLSIRKYLGSHVVIQVTTGALMGDGSLYGICALRSGWQGSYLALDAEIY